MRMICNHRFICMMLLQIPAAVRSPKEELTADVRLFQLQGN